MICIDDVLDYDPETGIFTNVIGRGRAGIGGRAGFKDVHGYRRITINGIKYYEHHLAWLWVYSEWPKEIDHINGVCDDNRISNLRECSRTQNNFNSYRRPGASGLLGAYLDKRNLKWYSHIQIGGKVKFLGYHGSAEEANKAYMQARELYAGEFNYHERRP